MKKIFISFDYDNDRNYRYLLSAFNRNPEIDLIFSDHTPTEIQSNDIGRIKSVLTTKIRTATYILVLIGKHANTKHKNSIAIGQLNWQHWELVKSIEERKKIIAVKLDRNFSSPSILHSRNAKWVYGFTIPGIIKAINEL